MTILYFCFSVKNNFEIIIATAEEHFSVAKVLFLEYAKELNVDLCFQGFDEELKNISVQYNAPGGVLLLLTQNNDPVGCVCLRKTSDEVAEMKRMYIKKEFRGKGLSKQLIEKLLDHAKELKYKAVRLDTLPQMKEAMNLYLCIGFKEIQPYRFNPVEGTRYMQIQF